MNTKIIISKLVKWIPIIILMAIFILILFPERYLSYHSSHTTWMILWYLIFPIFLIAFVFIPPIKNSLMVPKLLLKGLFVDFALAFIATYWLDTTLGIVSKYLPSESTHKKANLQFAFCQRAGYTDYSVLSLDFVDQSKNKDTLYVILPDCHKLGAYQRLVDKEFVIYGQASKLGVIWKGSCLNHFCKRLPSIRLTVSPFIFLNIF